MTRRFFIPANHISAAQLDRMADAYASLEQQYGDNPNAIADTLGLTRGTGAVLRLRCRERRLS